MVLTKSNSHHTHSFVDRDMFMRHFGHGVGHLRYERQHEIDPDQSHNDGMELDDSDELHNAATIGEGDASESDSIGDPDLDSSEPECDSESDGYVTY
jgi:hypothetical protein